MSDVEKTLTRNGWGFFKVHFSLQTANNLCNFLLEHKLRIS